jgi:class 3 adenylate cyclase
VALFESCGPKTRRLRAYLRRRARAQSGDRRGLDIRASAKFQERRAIVFTDSADFTQRTVKHGILHFLMLFERLVPAARRSMAALGGELVKVEADSLLMRFPDPARACRGVQSLEALLRKLNRGRPANERLCFSYGIGYGDVLDLESDVFGLEVNLASRLGEDVAHPGEALLTPSAVAALPPALRRRLLAYRSVRIGDADIAIHRLPLRPLR